MQASRPAQRTRLEPVWCRWANATVAAAVDAALDKAAGLDRLSVADKRQDQYVDDQLFVDFKAGYFITPQLQLTFEAQNLTDESYYVYTGNRRYNAQYEEYGPTYKVGLTLTHF